MATQTNHSLHEQSEGFKSLSPVPNKHIGVVFITSTVVGSFEG